MNRVCALSISLMLLCCSFLSGFLLPESSALGEIMGAVSARYTALGGAAVMGEGWINPALATQTRGLVVFIGGGFIKSGEKRKKTVFDLFNNRIGDITVADNSFVFLEPSLVSVSYTTSYNAGIGVAILPVLSYDYRYSREVRDNFYILNETIAEEGSGKTYLGNAAIAYELIEERCSVGFAFNFYSGTREYTFNHDYVDPSRSDENEEFSRTLAGNGFSFGLHARPITRIQLGGFVSTKAALGDIAEDYIPLRVGSGMIIIPPNVFPALFIVDAVYERWNEIDDNYDDVIKLHLGVEHSFSPTLDARFGFGYETSYLSKDMPRVFFTFGFGFQKGNFGFDTGVTICSFDFGQSDLAIRDLDGVTRVEETLVKVLFSVSYKR